MSRPIPETPPLPYPSGSSNDDLNGFNQDLIKALYVYLSDVARRVNESLPKDGTEAMQADLDMGGFAIVNSSGGGGGGGLPETPLAIVHGGTGATSASVARTNLGLGNVNNTADTAKPVSTLQAAADQVVSGVPEFITISPSGNTNDLASGASTHTGVETILLLTPSVSMKLTGIVATGMAQGKRIHVRNAASPMGASNFMIIIEENSASSTSGNRFHAVRRTQFSRAPIVIGPGRSVIFEYDGTNWQAIPTIKFYENLYNQGSNIGNNETSSTAGNSVGSGSTFAASTAITDVNSALRACFRLSATTATAFGSYYPDWVGNEGIGNGAWWTVQCAMVNPLATGTVDYDGYWGIGNMNVKPLLDYVGWNYNRSTSLLFQTASFKAGTATRVPITGLTVAANTFVWLGTYVNGDGTRADFFYSTDEGETWTFTASITTNLPIFTQRVTAGFAIYKKLSTTSVSIYTESIFEGHSYDN